jgi:hypothetical protein
MESTKPRRITDLDADDIDCLLSLCEKRIHTISTHLKRSSHVDNTSVMKAASQLYITVDKLKNLKDRLVYVHRNS